MYLAIRVHIQLRDSMYLIELGSGGTPQAALSMPVICHVICVLELGARTLP